LDPGGGGIPTQILTLLSDVLGELAIRRLEGLPLLLLLLFPAWKSV